MKKTPQPATTIWETTIEPVTLALYATASHELRFRLSLSDISTAEPLDLPAEHLEGLFSLVSGAYALWRDHLLPADDYRRGWMAWLCQFKSFLRYCTDNDTSPERFVGLDQ